ncbi:HK97 family phage prohead protease [Mesorhizobium sp. M2D.F.Ca.ET.225.01.1.1]|uniref:HK97 family phage prohead protease n=1 Tax=unclassified Mesorhizobium TaxID=325217 RepID=UPI000FD4D799|nr:MULTISPECIES: HK97 family phage prohead protease [unclassified Mesorhizobium]TGP65442.1 HK97 family phage prohead protease [Mesorhizobium sp. M2D.F.Ca.ET.226.01.1.1]TGP71921.1 HK97 family phage prohead protease [Mesorhizobium sp. M2D.F.Ca.ET.225.01.1.1]
MMIEHMAVSLGEVKLDGADGDMTFSGYGAVFGNVDSYGDVIAKGAFKKTLADAKKSSVWPAMLSQHGGMFGEDATPIGVWTEMREDDIGLYVEGKLANTERGKEAYQLLKMTPRPAYSGLSIGFRATEWTMRSKPEEPRRTLTAVDLLEVSLVTFPANSKARVMSVKNEFNPRAIEDGLREAGLSRADSVRAVAVFKSMLLRDEVEPNSDHRDDEAAAEVRTERALSDLAAKLRAMAKAV